MIIRDTLITKEEESYEKYFFLLSQEQQDSPFIMSKVNFFSHISFWNKVMMFRKEDYDSENI